MPSQQGIRGDDGGDLSKQLVAELLGLDCQTAALLVAQPKAPGPDLFAQDAILFAEIVDDVLLLLIEPAGEGNGRRIVEDRVALGVRLAFQRPR